MFASPPSSACNIPEDHDAPRKDKRVHEGHRETRKSRKMHDVVTTHSFAARPTVERPHRIRIIATETRFRSMLCDRMHDGAGIQIIGVGRHEIGNLVFLTPRVVGHPTGDGRIRMTKFERVTHFVHEYHHKVMAIITRSKRGRIEHGWCQQERPCDETQHGIDASGGHTKDKENEGENGDGEE